MVWRRGGRFEGVKRGGWAGTEPGLHWWARPRQGCRAADAELRGFSHSNTVLFPCALLSPASPPASPPAPYPPGRKSARFLER